MNISLGRFLQGILGAVLGACGSLSYYNHGSYFSHINITIIIIVSAISFFVFFLLGDHIFDLWGKTLPRYPSYKDESSKKEKDDEGDH